MKTPFVTKEQLDAITAQYPTPFHIYDEKASARTPAACVAPLPGIPVTGNILP